MSDYQVSKLGNYSIVRLIGRGGFANVYLGEHIYLKIPAAIKVLNIQLVNDTLENFLNEARIVALLEHPRIVRVLEFGVEGGITPFLVMNYAENGTLRQFYPRKSVLPWGSILSYTRQVAEALQYAHDHGVIHRDVKPENMLLGKNKRIQLSDFGLALLVQGTPHNARSAGTMAYMAPEQLQGNPCKASDQYALGVVVYEWLCGSLPFTGSEREMTIQQLYSPPPPIHTKVRGLAPAIEKVVMKALSKDPAARFASVHEFAQALENAASSEALLDTRKQSATSPVSPNSAPIRVKKQANSVSAEERLLHTTSMQGPVEIPSAPDFFPQLPLLVYDSPLTNNGRILQPSLGSSGPSLGEQFSRPITSSSQDDAFQHFSHVSLSLSAPDVLPVSDLSTVPSQSVAQRIFAQQNTSFPPASKVGSRSSHPFRRLLLVVLVIVTVIGLIIAGIGIGTQFTHTPRNVSIDSHTGSLPPVLATATVQAAKPQSATPSPDTHHTSANIPATATRPTTLPTGTPGVVSTPTSQPTPVPHPSPTSQPTATSTPVVLLTVAIISAPSSVPAGSALSVVIQASKGGVLISLSRALRYFGTQTANSQGIATFVITAPFLGKRMLLTATATDTNGNQVKSKTITITIT
jgi:serine/threonine protein kinase